MFDEDSRSPAAQAVSLGDNLAPLSIEDLEARVEALRAEIARVETELTAKRAGRAAAEAVFGGS